MVKSQSMPVASRTRSKREAQISQIFKDYRKKKWREEKMNHIKTNVVMPDEGYTSRSSKQDEEEPADIICIDDDDDISTDDCSDPVTSTSGEDNDDSDDLDYGEEEEGAAAAEEDEEEEKEEEEEEEEEQEVEVVSEYNAAETCQIYKSTGKPVAGKRKRKYELDEEEEEEQEVELVSQCNAVETCQIYNTGKPVAGKRKSKYQLDEEEDEEQKVELVSEDNAAETCQIYNSHGKPVACKRKSTYESDDGSLDDDEDIIDLTASKPKLSGRKLKVKSSSSESVDLIKVLTDSIWNKEDSDSNLEEALKEDTNLLPAKFTFGVEDKMAPEEADADENELEEELWAEMKFCMASSELGCPPVVENKETDILEGKHDTAFLCHRGRHQLILDEEIGMKCQYCSFVELEIKYIVPPFITGSFGNFERRDLGLGGYSILDGLQYEEFSSDMPGCDPSANIQGTVWEIIPPNIRSQLYPHQREGFEFIWNNIAGGIYRDLEKNTYSDGGGGCIVSHAPGTGKTLLTIVFLYSYLKVNPDSRPVIVAPSSMLLTWGEEFDKWKSEKFGILFHNLNNSDFSGGEKVKAIGLYEKFKQSVSNKELAKAKRLVKLLSWKSDGGILGISYTMFEKLAGERKCSPIDERIRKILLKLPGLFVFDEGHTPRNDETLMWKALSNIETERRIILSGTPFQNNFEELYNTMCLVRPKFAERIQSGHQRFVDKNHGLKKTEAKRTWACMTGAIGKVCDALEAEKLEEIRAMIKPFVHVHKGDILQARLKGLRHSVVVFQPSALQKKILQHLKQTKNAFSLDYHVSLISIHPSLLLQISDLKDRESIRSIVSMDELERIRLKPDQGVKTKFLKELLKLSEALNEKVIVFSQYLEPLNLIMEQLTYFFKWKEGKEILYMHGKCNVKQRQASINVFNDPTSKARVMLASTKACSEGINLVGGSRVVLLDVTWNPSVERQAISRAYRLGQKKVVYTYHLISSGTMEGLKFQRQAGKEQMSNLVFSPSDSGAHGKNKVHKVLEDDLLEEMVQHEQLKSTFYTIIKEPKDSDLIATFGDF